MELLAEEVEGRNRNQATQPREEPVDDTTVGQQNEVDTAIEGNGRLTI